MKTVLALCAGFMLALLGVGLARRRKPQPPSLYLRDYYESLNREKQNDLERLRGSGGAASGDR